MIASHPGWAPPLVTVPKGDCYEEKFRIDVMRAQTTAGSSSGEP